MVKCKECNNKLQEIFLGKKLGTPVRSGKKVDWLCSNCQRASAQSKSNE